MRRDFPEQGSILLCPSMKPDPKGGAILMRTASTMDPDATPRMVAGPEGATEALPQRVRAEARGKRLVTHLLIGLLGKAWEQPKGLPKGKGGGLAPPETTQEAGRSLEAHGPGRESRLSFKGLRALLAMTMRAISWTALTLWDTVRVTS